MADFSFLSGTSKSRAVEQIIAEAMDHCVLQQVAAINCSSFSDSLLPSNLESRFQRLKTFPSTSSKPFPKTPLAPDSNNPVKNLKNSPQPISENSGKNKDFSFGNIPSPSGSSNSSSGHLTSPNFYPKKGEKKGKYGNITSEEGKDGKLQSKFSSKKGKDANFLSRSLSFGSSFSDFSTESVKPGCFWCTPKKKKKKKSSIETKNHMFELDCDDWGKHDEIMSDLKSFSERKQKKLMKLAKMEEEKINKEAEKIVKWAKQASSRMEFSEIMDDDLSDDDDDHGHNFGLH